MGAALLLLLGERSQANSYGKHVIELYLYATGAQRQVISVLNSLGICSSYPTLAGSQKPGHNAKETLVAGRPEDPVTVEPLSSNASDSSESDIESDGCRTLLELESEDIPLSATQRTLSTMLLSASTSAAPVLPYTPTLSKHLGLLTRISMACRTTTKRLAQTDLLGHVYNNINMVFKIAEQILGRTDSQENGTCATVFPLFEASDKDMKTEDLLSSRESAPPLSIRDIILTSEEETTGVIPILGIGIRALYPFITRFYIANQLFSHHFHPIAPAVIFSSSRSMHRYYTAWSLYQENHLVSMPNPPLSMNYRCMLYRYLRDIWVNR